MMNGTGRIIRIALCQYDFPVGDIDGNFEKIRSKLFDLKNQGVDLALFPELTLSGYPPEDLLLKPRFAESAAAALHELASETKDLVAVVGFPELSRDLYNAAGVLANGKVAAVYRKRYLPNYAVFDEQRYFARGEEALVLDLDGIHLGVTICEDLWYPGGPVQWAAINAGAEAIINISASPYHRTKGLERERMLATRCADYSCYLAFCNAVGGQDELVFDGHSLIINPLGTVTARGRQFEENLIISDVDLRLAPRRRLHDPRWRQQLTNAGGQIRVVSLPKPIEIQKPILPQAVIQEPLGPEEEVFQALRLGTRDYFQKNGFRHALLGLSGGIDSALSLVIAVDALGSEAVSAIFMPSRYTASHNYEDARAIANRLNVKLTKLPIDDLFEHYMQLLKEPFTGTDPNVAEENLQARIRGNLIMALSNKFNWLVLTTGNKSEMSVGYATLYGDMAGGFAVLKDVPKTWVYRLARWQNRDHELIPTRILEKAPSAELREDQLDTDSLPPYDVLDQIIHAYVEEDRSPDEIEGLGLDRSLVYRIVEMIDRAEYKRRQAPPGVRISQRAFGKDRRLPITNKYKF